MTNIEATTRYGALFVQRNGVNQPIEYVGCHGVEGVSEDLGTPSRQYCMNSRGEYVAVAETVAPPGDISFSVTTGLRAAASIFDSLRGCQFNLYITNSLCGKPSVFPRYDTVTVLRNVRISGIDRGNMVARDTDERIGRTFSMVAAPPAMDAWRLRPALLGTSSIMDASADFYSLSPCSGLVCGRGCAGTCGSMIASLNTGEEDEDGMIAVISPNGTIELRANRPFAGTDAAARLVACLDNGRILALWTPAAVNQFSWAYSDDGGYNWVQSMSGVAPTAASAIAWSIYHIGNYVWVGAAEGYIYRSTDGGATYEAVEAGAISTATYGGVMFRSETEGYAVSNDALVQTIDGGETWLEITAPAATGMKGVWATNDYLWVIGSKLWYRDINGSTWYERDIPLSYPLSSAPLTRIRFFNDHIGAILQTGNVAGGDVNRIFYTVTGGAEGTWLTYDLGLGSSPFALEGEGLFIAASTLNDIQWCGSNTLFGVGDDAKAVKLSAF